MDLPNGNYRNIPEADYHALRYVNASSLKAGRTSMAHMRLAMAGGGGSSPAKELGTLAHRLILEPESRHLITLAPDFGDLRTKAGKEAKAAWMANLKPDMEVVDAEVFAAASAMAAAADSHRTMRELLNVAGGFNELTIVWTDADTGVRCKARIDRYITGHLILDLKTARAATAFAFTRATVAYGYHLQAAWYRHAIAQATGELLPFVFAVLESSAPYSCALYELDDATITQAAEVNSSILRQWAAAVASGEYSSIQADGQVQVLNLPTWAFDNADANVDAGNI